MKKLIVSLLLSFVVTFPLLLFAAEPPWWTNMKRNCRAQGGTISEYYSSYTGCHLPIQSPTQSPEPTKRQGPPGPNLVLEDGQWIPEDGYDWVDDSANNDYRVKWVPGRYSKKWPHVVASNEIGTWHPEDGYVFTNTDIHNDDFGVRWVPGRYSKKWPHVVARETEGRWQPEDGYKFVDARSGWGVVEDDQIKEAIRVAEGTITLSEMRNRLMDLAQMDNYDRADAGLRILTTGWLITLPSAADRMQREILIEQTKKELHGLMNQVLGAVVKQIATDMMRLTPFAWNPFGAEKRRQIAESERRVIGAQVRAEEEIYSDWMLTAVRSGSQRSALKNRPGPALSGLIDTYRSRSWSN